jgi:hypothetical protein
MKSSAQNADAYPMDAQSTTIMSVVLAIVIGYFAGRAIGV